MHCPDIQRILDDHCSQTLSAAERAHVDAHLAICDRCADAWLANESLLGAVIAAPRATLLTDIVAALPVAQPSAPFYRRMPSVSLAAAAAALVLALAVVLSTRPGPPAADPAPELVTDERAATEQMPEFRFVAGRHYERVAARAATGAANGKLQVVEFFMYRCLPCFSFEPYFTEWAGLRSDEVEIVRVPVSWGPAAALHARAFYAAEALGKADDVHQAFFEALHVENASLASERELAAFFARFGVGLDAFERALRSEAVAAKVAQADDLIRRFAVSGTPTLVINGEFLTGGGMADSYEHLIEIVDELTTLSAACRRSTAPPRCNLF